MRITPLFFNIFTVFTILFLGHSAAFATISIPSGLSDGEQELVLQILGFGTSFRPVDNPYPLGGYSGLELGMSLESLSTEDIGYFGAHGTVERNTVYPRLTVGKGIFDSVDLFFSFMPQNESTGIGMYGGGLRWGFFQATFVPAVFSLLVSANNTNINNMVITQTTGVDLIAGINMDPLSFYLGAGTLYGQAQFDRTITSSATQTNQIGRSFHTLLGVNLAINEVFAACEIDTYSNTTVSLKFGTRL